MKKILLLTTFFLSSFFANAQFEVRETSTNNLVSDNQEIGFTEAGCAYSDPCNWKFKVTNTSANPIYMKIFVDGLEGTDGSNFQLCFAGVCLNNVTLGSSYPNNAAMIASGATNSAGNNFWNQNAPETTTPMSWTLRFQAFDDADNEIGTPLTVTYRFDPNLSIEESDLTPFEVYPTMADDILNISSREDLSLTFYNLLGKKVQEVNINSGDNVLDVSHLAAQPYILRFTNDMGKQFTKKIVIR